MGLYLRGAGIFGEGNVIYQYPQDDGCEVSPLCRECPLVQCKYDDISYFYRWQKEQRHKEIVETMDREGLTIRETALRFKVNPRTVTRAMATVA